MEPSTDSEDVCGMTVAWSLLKTSFRFLAVHMQTSDVVRQVHDCCSIIGLNLLDVLLLGEPSSEVKNSSLGYIPQQSGACA